MKHHLSVAGIVIAASIAVSFIWRISTSATSPSVTFLGYTNLTKGLAGTFKVTNGDQGAADLWVESLPWARVHTAELDPLRLIHGVSEKGKLLSFYMVERLKIRQSFVVHLAPPADGQPCRPTFLLREPESKWRVIYNKFASTLRFLHLSMKQRRVIVVPAAAIPANTSLEPTARAASVRIEMDSSRVGEASLPGLTWLWLSLIR